MIVPLESISSVTSVSKSLFEIETPIPNPLTSALTAFIENAKNVIRTAEYTAANNFFIYISPL